MAPALRFLDVATMFLIASICMMGGAMAARPFAGPVASSNDLISAICSGSPQLVCANDMQMNSNDLDIAKAAAGVRDSSIHTINDVQRDFFLESALVAGGTMSLDENLRDPAPTRAFLTTSAAAELPALNSANASQLMKHFGVAHDSAMATAVATAAYLCGSAALPGEARQCVTSVNTMAAFVASELGENVKLYSTAGAPTSAPSAKAKAPVTIVDAAKGSVAEGSKIVVCHHVDFPSALYYCHRVTGTKIVMATLKTEASKTAAGLDIKAVGICHISTSMWLSTHPAFKALNIPRGEEACHWLVQNDIVFVPAVLEKVQE